MRQSSWVVRFYSVSSSSPTKTNWSRLKTPEFDPRRIVQEEEYTRGFCDSNHVQIKRNLIMMDIGKRPLLMLNITSVFALDGSTNPNNNINHEDSDLLSSSAEKIFAWNLYPYRHVVKNKIAANYDLRNGYLKWALHGKLLIRLHHSPSHPHHL